MDTLSFNRMVCLYRLENCGSRFFFTQETLISFSGYGGVRVWNLSSGELINQFHTANPEKGGNHAISLDGKIVFYNFFEWLCACDVLTGKQLFEVVLGREPCAMTALDPKSTGADLVLAMRGDACGLSTNDTILLKLQLEQKHGLRNDGAIPCVKLNFVIVPLSKQYPGPLCIGFNEEEEAELSLISSPDGKTILCHTYHPQIGNRKFSKHGYHQWWDAIWMKRILRYETSATWTADALAQREIEHPQLQVPQYLASGTREGILKVWNLATDQEVLSIPGGKSPSFMTPDGQFLLCATETRETLIWNLHTNQELRTLPGYPRAISFDARFIIIGSTDGYTEVWGIPHAE